MTRDSSSCNTLSKYIISRSDTIAPLITIISSPLIIPGTEMQTTILGMIVPTLFKSGWKKNTMEIKIVIPALDKVDIFIAKSW